MSLYEFFDKHWPDLVALFLIVLGVNLAVWGYEHTGEGLIMAGLSSLGLRRSRSADRQMPNGSGSLNNIT